MRKGSFGQYLAMFLVIVGVLYIIGSASEATEPKCIKAGCDNKQASGSSYCYLHKPYTGHSSYDSGYDSIYDDGDYDWDRYQKDKDYADGVDDAMNEFDEDW